MIKRLVLISLVGLFSNAQAATLNCELAYLNSSPWRSVTSTTGSLELSSAESQEVDLDLSDSLHDVEAFAKLFNGVYFLGAQFALKGAGNSASNVSTTTVPAALIDQCPDNAQPPYGCGFQLLSIVSPAITFQGQSYDQVSIQCQKNRLSTLSK